MICNLFKKAKQALTETKTPQILKQDISECFVKVHNRGVIPFDVMLDIIEYVNAEPDSLFLKNDKVDIYSNVFKELGPWTSTVHRKAVMCEVLRVLGGFESSWRWGEGRDMSADNTSLDTQEAGMFQVSANSMYFTGSDYMKSLFGTTDKQVFIDRSKDNKQFAIGQAIRVLRNTVNHHGPVKRKEINVWLSRKSVAQIETVLRKLHKEIKVEERPSPSKEGANLKRCPFAIHDEGGVMPTKGKYRKGHPEGAVVHFTAGSSAKSSRSWLAKMGYPCIVIDMDGTIYQNFDIDRFGSHAGTSYHPALGSSVSQYLIGIEIDNGGRLRWKDDHWETWFGETIPKERTRTIVEPRYEFEVAGTYEKYTKEQEEALIRFLKWLYHNNPKVFNPDLILGHDEVRNRVQRNGKNDPSGALSMPMPELRKLIKEG